MIVSTNMSVRNGVKWVGSTLLACQDEGHYHEGTEVKFEGQSLVALKAWIREHEQHSFVDDVDQAE